LPCRGPSSLLTLNQTHAWDQNSLEAPQLTQQEISNNRKQAYANDRVLTKIKYDYLLELRNNYGIDCTDYLTLANDVGEEALTNYLLGYREDIKPQDYKTDLFLSEKVEKQDPQLVYNGYNFIPETVMSGTP
jgi:hypothetical protein